VALACPVWQAKLADRRASVQQCAAHCLTITCTVPPMTRSLVGAGRLLPVPGLACLHEPVRPGDDVPLIGAPTHATSSSMPVRLNLGSTWIHDARLS
jgi:hypothetical protein